MKIVAIYKNNPVPQLLQQHQIRAAALGAYLSDNFENPNKVDKVLIIKSLLLHDMGNVIKFDLANNFLTTEENKNIKFWEAQQKIYKNKYNNDEHLATYQMVKELKNTEDVYEVLTHTGSSRLQEVLASPNFNLKIVTYADLRCAPFAVVKINERFDEIIKRYKGRDHQLSDVEEVELRRKRGLELEIQLQNEISSPLEEITDKTIEKYINQVKEQEI